MDTGTILIIAIIAGAVLWLWKGRKPKAKQKTLNELKDEEERLYWEARIANSTAKKLQAEEQIRRIREASDVNKEVKRQ